MQSLDETILFSLDDLNKQTIREVLEKKKGMMQPTRLWVISCQGTQLTFHAIVTPET